MAVWKVAERNKIRSRELKELFQYLQVVGGGETQGKEDSGWL